MRQQPKTALGGARWSVGYVSLGVIMHTSSQSLRYVSAVLHKPKPSDFCNFILGIVVTVLFQCCELLCLCLAGLKEKTEQKLKVIDAKNRKLTPWQEYREKRAKKKLEKKEAKAVRWQYLLFCL